MVPGVLAFLGSRGFAGARFGVWGFAGARFGGGVLGFAGARFEVWVLGLGLSQARRRASCYHEMRG